MSALTLINPGETFLLAIAPTIDFLIIWAVIYIMLAGERLIVCERGILFGSVAPFLHPRAIGYDQILPGSLVPISGKITRVYKQPGVWAITNVRVVWWSRQGVSLVGPLVAEAVERRGAAQQALLAGSRGSRPEAPWIIGTRAPAEQVTADIARAAEARSVRAGPTHYDLHTRHQPLSRDGLVGKRSQLTRLERGRVERHRQIRRRLGDQLLEPFARCAEPRDGDRRAVW